MLLISSCAKSTPLPMDSMPAIGIPMDKMNSQFRIIAPQGWNSYKIKTGVSLLVQVLSDEPIAFKGDLGARMFIYQNGEWIELKNRILASNYETWGIRIAQLEKDQAARVVDTHLAPLVPDPTRVTSIRVIAVGNIYKDGQVTEEQTAAYVDVTLRP